MRTFARRCIKRAQKKGSSGAASIGVITEEEESIIAKIGVWRNQTQLNMELLVERYTLAVYSYNSCWMSPSQSVWSSGI